MSELIFQSKTKYSPVFIHKIEAELHLKFDINSRAVQTVIDCEQPQLIKMKNLQYLMGILNFIPTPKKILLLGIGGGSMVHFFRYHFPDCELTGVDFDAELIEIAQQYLMLPKPSSKTQYISQDAQQFIAESTQQYDLIVVDIFNGSQSPEWLLSQKTTQQLSKLLNKKGAIAYNTLLTSDTSFKDFYSLLRVEFGQQTLCLESDEYENILLYALNFKNEDWSMMDYLYTAQELSARFSLPMNEILAVIYSINPVDSGVI